MNYYHRWISVRVSWNIKVEDDKIIYKMKKNSFLIIIKIKVVENELFHLGMKLNCNRSSSNQKIRYEISSFETSIVMRSWLMILKIKILYNNLILLFLKISFYIILYQISND